MTESAGIRWIDNGGSCEARVGQAVRWRKTRRRRASRICYRALEVRRQSRIDQVERVDRLLDGRSGTRFDTLLVEPDHVWQAAR
jgi:hypothetical protein